MSSIGNTNPIVEKLLLQSLMGIRLNNSNTNATTTSIPPPFESEEDLLRLLLNDSDSESDTDYEDDESSPADKSRRLARVESKLEKEIIRAIHSDPDSLNPNSGQAVSIGEHHICVAFHQEKPSDDYRVWEWHGHVMLFDHDAGYSPEYIYGNYFQRLPPNAAPSPAVQSGGLKELIRRPNNDSPRVVHRNVNAASSHDGAV